MNKLLIILFPLLIEIESNGDDKAIGDGGDSVGCMQISEIMVQDVNRILGGQYFKYTDRLSRSKSKKIATVYFTHYKPCLEGLSLEDKLVLLGRNWNGGPKGCKKKATVKYGDKVRKLYRKKIKK